MSARMPIRMRAHAHAEHQWLGCGAAFLLHRDARPAPIWHVTSRSFPDYFPQTERIKIAAAYLELVPSRLAAVRHHLEMPESGRFIHKMLSVTVMHVGQSLEASRQTFLGLCPQNGCQTDCVPAASPIRNHPQRAT